MTSKLSKIATAIAFLAIVAGCDNGVRITTESQFTASNQNDESVALFTAKYEAPPTVISHASGKYEESDTFSTYDVHGNRL